VIDPDRPPVIDPDRPGAIADRRVAEIAAEVRRRPSRCGTVRVVAVDGGAGAGKTTFGGRLAQALGATVVHTDDLIDGWGGQFEFAETLRSQVLAPLARGEPGRYRRYDWTRKEFADTVPVPVSAFLVVEGVSAIAACGEAATYRILLLVPRAERERRWTQRDQVGLQPEWTAWLDAEDEYFAAHPPAADLILTS
jgi:cytidylate kinase